MIRQRRQRNPCWSGQSTINAQPLPALGAQSYGYGWGRTTSTPLDQVRLLEALRQHVSPLLTVDEEWLLSTMRGVDAGQTWGAAPLGRGPGRVIEVKNGWSPFSDNGRWRLSSVGHVRDARHDYTVAILSNGWRSTGAGIPRLNAVGRAVYRITGH
ncbi:hypothetical protein [Arsenicicoccus dermatophilus]|uniref:hypothetical protein n=1 Tax=Arsenicicoccus dermatophilus TaxID=1076331 RepID=UPI001F4C88CF|nr:hypothetical protein [Arsenicicoccus dermatophilus]MCH8611771.1 hypothetical protein [Arsenicicoccus dermatophilus]